MYRVRSSDELLQHTGQGDAYVFSPLDLSTLNHSIMANKADKIAREKAIADRNVKMAEQFKYNDDAIFYPYQQEQKEDFHKIEDHLAYLRRNNIYDPSHPDVIKFNEMKNDLAQKVAKGKDIQQSYLSAIAAVQQDPYLKKDQTISAINDKLHDDTGISKSPINDVNPGSFREELNKPENFNLQAHGGAVAKQIPESVRSYLHQEQMMGGSRTNEDIVKSKFHLYDDKGNLVKDEQGNPVINITPETKHIFFNQDPRAKGAVDYEVGKQNKEIAAYNALPENRYNQKPLVTEDDVIRQNVSPYAYNYVNKNLGTLNKPNSDNGGGLSNEEKAIARHQSLIKILNGDKSEIGNLVGGTIDGRKINDVKFIKNDVTKSIHVGKGTNPKTGEKTGKATDIEVPKYQVVFTLTDKKGQPKQFTLGGNTKAELYYELNNAYNTAPGQYKIAKEPLDKNRGDSTIEEDEEEDPAGLNEEETKDPAGIL